ncbi:MAG: magnesium transporter CorA [Sulfobacillus acidophilus]|uniref:Magnesium transporter CorA n=1 Tax=Sulfobacillus acidophilus TaxID=53633 RepID=A0A2T2WHM4_9FIRM|nr:MAG: magnesium transporter CorA [Sulfobacillus acidophilus]
MRSIFSLPFGHTTGMASFEKTFSPQNLQWEHIVGDTTRLETVLQHSRFSLASYDFADSEVVRAEFDDYARFYTIRVLSLKWFDHPQAVQMTPIYVWADDTHVVSFAKEPLQAVERARQKLSHNPDWVSSSARLVYYLLDEVLASLFAFLDKLYEQVELLEDHVLTEHRTQGIEHHIFALKREALRVRRAMASMRDAISQLVRYWTAQYPDDPFYYMELYDHMLRQFDSVDTYRELVNSVLDLHLSTVSNRLNEIVKTLTLVTTVLLPASLMAALYGMNFDYLPLVHYRFGFFVVLGLIVAVSSLVYGIFRYRRWI